MVLLARLGWDGTEGVALWLPLLCYALNFAATHRARGAGILNRYICAVWLGITTGALTWYFHGDLRAIIGNSVAMAIGYFVGVVEGWGDYFDFTNFPNNEIAWIDNIADKLQAKAGWGADAMDMISMMMRSLYYVPLSIGMAFATGSAWLLLPAPFVWIDGVVYERAHAWIPGDYVKWAEILNGLIRGALVAAALAYWAGTGAR